MITKHQNHQSLNYWCFKTLFAFSCVSQHFIYCHYPVSECNVNSTLTVYIFSATRLLFVWSLSGTAFLNSFIQLQYTHKVDLYNIRN